MTESLDFKVDKFTFRTATDRLYSHEGLWAKQEGKNIRIGISDYLQQRSGDVAFAEVKPVGAKVAVGDEIVVIETIKVNISLLSPIKGQVIAINPAMETSPEVINQDPYGNGWMAVIEASNWEADLKQLLDPDAYFTQIKQETEQESNKHDE